MRAFRITLATYGADAREVFCGRSGWLVDGRWHARGRHLDYAAGSRSLAVLERLVHYRRFDQLQPHVLCVAEIPETAILDVPALPPGWDGPGLLPAAQALGNAWFDGVQSPALRVPSAVTPGEWNLLLNARHPDWRWGWVSPPEPFSFDARLHDLMAAARRPSKL